jgi:hypothetical protein
MIRRRGLEDEADALSDNNPGLAALYASAVRGPLFHLTGRTYHRYFYNN